MSETRYRALLVEDNPADLRLVREMLRDEPQSRLDLAYVATLGEALAALERDPFDVILLDLGLPDSLGLDTFQRLHKSFPKIPTVVLTGNDDTMIGFRAVQEGAQDYLVKTDIRSSPLVRAVYYAIERKKAEEALRASERRYRDVLETTGDGIWTVDRDGRFTFANEQTAAILGTVSAQLSEMTIFDFVPSPSTRPAGSIVTALRTGVSQRFDFEIVRFDGSQAWVTISAKPFYDQSGKFAGALGAITDITKRVRAEDALRRSEAALKEAQRIAKLGHWEFNAMTRATTWSDEVYRIFDFDRSVAPSEEVFKALIDPRDLARFETAMTDLVRSAEDQIDLDLRMITAAGKPMVISERVFCDRDANGAVIGFHGTCQDVTDRKRIEESLRQRSESLEASNLELERFNRLAVGRELRMIQLKAEINELCHQLGKPVPYVVSHESERISEES